MPDVDATSLLVYEVHEYFTPNSQKTVLFFCPFGIRSWLLNLPGLPIWRLRRNGYTVISYSYRTAIATTSLQLTIANIDAIIADTDARIAKTPPTTEIICFGTSMGTVLAANVAARHDRIKKVILNLSYADISDHIVALPGIRTIPTKVLQSYLESAGGEANMRAAFDPYSPLTLTTMLHGKKLLLYTSRTDNILKHIHTEKFRAALSSADIELSNYENRRGGHYFAALVNYLHYRRWLTFLQS